MVSPFAVRLQMESVETSGKTVGRIYAISTVGTLIRQFYLILRYLLRSTRKLGITPTQSGDIPNSLPGPAAVPVASSILTTCYCLGFFF